MTQIKRFISLFMLVMLLSANVFVVHGTTVYAESPQRTPSDQWNAIQELIDDAVRISGTLGIDVWIYRGRNVAIKQIAVYG